MEVKLLIPSVYCRSVKQVYINTGYRAGVLLRNYRTGMQRAVLPPALPSLAKGQGTWASAAWGRGAVSPWIFKHGTNTVNRGLKMLFFGLFFVAPLPWKRLNSAIFRYFFLIFVFFRWLPPGKFSAYALVRHLPCCSLIRIP